VAPNERQRARDELSAPRDRHDSYRLGRAEEAARLRQKQLDQAPSDQAKWLQRIFWLQLIAMVIVPCVQGLVLATFLK
jgi:hypothetical protein